jgi:signal transduction histidine kinase
VSNCLPILFLAILSPLIPLEGNAQPAAKKIFLLNSYHPNYKWSADITHTVLEEFNDIVPHENIQIEFLDARRSLDDSSYDSYILKYMRGKYEGKKFDIILSFDDYAIEFLYQYGDILFPDIPIIYGGVNVFSKELLKKKKNLIGIYEGLAIKENLDLIYQIQPSVKKVIMLSDITQLGTGMETVGLSDAALWKRDKNLQVELYKVGDFDSLRLRLKNSTVDTAYLLLAIHKDKNGKYFSYQKELVDVTTESKSPVYGMWGSLLIGNGCVGGYMTSAAHHATEVCSIAKQVLNGVDMASITMPEKTRFFPVFDDRLLLQYDIDKTLLPSNSEIHFFVNDKWRKYKPYFVTLLFFLFGATLVAFYLLYQNRKKSIVNNELQKMSRQIAITNNDIEQLVYSLSHSVRLYACHIQGFVNVHFLEKKNGLTDRNDEVINGINQAASNLLKTIDDIVVIGTRQRESGEVPTQVLLQKLVNSAEENAKRKTSFSDFSIVYSEDKKIIFSYWQSELQAVLKELITNAIRFKNPESALKIEVKSTQLENGHIQIKIKDNGRGMNLPLYGHRIFGLFERFHLDVSEKGTGLYLAKSIKIENSEVDRGTALAITLAPAR